MFCLDDPAHPPLVTMSAAHLPISRYDVTATLVEYPPAPLSLDELVLAGCELEQGSNNTSAMTAAKQPSPNADGNEPLPPAYSRLQEAHHRLSQMDDSAATENTGFGADLPPGLVLSNIADHPAFCDGLSRADADTYLKDLDIGTFLLRSYAAGGGGRAQGSTGGGVYRNGATGAAGQTPTDNNVVVMSVVCAGGSAAGSGACVRHLVFRAAEASGGIDFDNEVADEEADGGVSCGLVGPERTIDGLLLRIRKMGCEDTAGVAAGERVSARLHTPNASLLEALSR